MFYYVYVLKSSKNGILYVGYTKDLRKRVLGHNSGESFYTKRDGKWELIYAEAYVNSTDARIREKFLKSGRGRKVLRKQLLHTFRNWQSTDSAD